MHEFVQVLIPLFILLAIVVVVVSIGSAQKRREGLKKLAATLGWSFHAKHTAAADAAGWFQEFTNAFKSGYADQETYKPFGVFTRGGNRRPYNTLRGPRSFSLGDGPPRPCPVLAGDFSYTTGSGENETTRRFSYLLVELAAVTTPLPQTAVRPEGFMDKLGGLFGFDDIDFESVEFSDAFHVTGQDKRFAYDLLDPRMMQFLLDTRPPMVQVNGRHLCLAGGADTWTPEEFGQRLSWVERFLARWPRQLVGRVV